MARMSNRDRIAQKAAEAKAAADEAEKKAKKKAAKKTTKKTTKKAAKKTTSRTKAAATPERLKVVWSVCDAGGSVVKSYPYPEKAEAEAEVARLTEKKNRPYRLRADKVPMT